MLEVSEISQMLSNQAETVAKMLLPNGRLIHGEWQVGGVTGESGDSCKIRCCGSKQGVWSDFATGQSGDLLDLWAAVEGVDLATAIMKAKTYLGVNDRKHDKILKPPQKTFKRPQRPQGVKRISEESPVMRYLKEERKISQKAIDAYGVAEMASAKGKKGPWIVFPLKRGEELIGLKYLHLERKDEKKQIMAEGGCEPILFGWPTIPPRDNFITIVEGEIDALSLFTYGIPAVSVPFGGGDGAKQQWMDGEWEHLSHYRTIYLCLDDDEPGRQAAKAISERLGMHRCKMVRLPRKDANQCLQDGIEIDEIKLCFLNAEVQNPEELRSAKTYTDEVISRLYPDGKKKPGFDLPWPPNYGMRIEHGTLAIWTGYNGHGKSQMLGEVILSAIGQSQRACIASFEMSPAKTLARMVRQATGSEQPSRDDIRDEMERVDGRLWIFDLVGTGKADRLLDVFEFAFRAYGIRQFVIDSLMKVGIADDDYNGQKKFCDTLADFCKRLSITIHLVAHARKGGSELESPGKMDIKGTGGITDLADYVFSAFRNKPKEIALKEMEDGTYQGKATREDFESMPDAFLDCCKNREDGDLEGKIPLMFDRKSLNYTHFKRR